MSNRWVRFILAVLAIAAAAGAAYRVVQDEQRLAGDGAATRAAEHATENALITLVDLKATLHAYVAPGQGLPFWTTRAVMQIDKLRSAILELETAATGAGASLTQALDACDRLAAAEQRARDHMRAGQALLAGEVIFTEIRDLLDGLRIQIAHARDQIALAGGTSLTAVRREQTWLLAGAAGVLTLALLLLVPTYTRTPSTTSDVDGRRAAARERDTNDSGLGLNTYSPARESSPFDSQTPAAFDAASLSPFETRSDTAAFDALPLAPFDTRSDSAQGRHGKRGTTADGPDLSATASICVDLARVADSTEIAGLLARAATVLHATGIIVWVSSQDRLELFPVASTGYDEKVFARIGSISREASNLTAGALRDGATRVSSATPTSGSALAIPLAGPQGPVGVLSAEFRGGAPTVDPARVAVAEIFAAQLATLIGSLPAADNTPHIAQA